MLFNKDTLSTDVKAKIFDLHDTSRALLLDKVLEGDSGWVFQGFFFFKHVLLFVDNHSAAQKIHGLVVTH